ncbi:tRNA intron endonuclease [Ferroglobus placidus DSM 10642]|uniref:tRNA intron endonuclease n=1 Tax=Ferroglobus placidus (strain DSM 10642 / AEDII12DO) TaxID=589924 RepID=D3RY25_FERPA|nr:tRNA-intron lyase [Ferroglobus placidus]ADC65388.1 tRNA intron endonuclease [Ferroglobus placidus DSM 10642]
MKGELKGGYVELNFSQRLYSRNFGRRENSKLMLTLEESSYLMSKGTLEVYEKGRKVELPELLKRAKLTEYFVFERLRESGKKVRFGEFDDYVPVSEREVLSFEDLEKFAEKRLAVVDEESDVTFYRISRFDDFGRHEEKLREVRGFLCGERVIVEDVEIFRKYFYGTEKSGYVALSLVESLYLLEKGFLIMDEEEAEELRSAVDENLYEVYRDLRERRFMVKTGFKFGSDFRVYEAVRSVKELTHSKYLVKLREEVSMRELAGDTRLAQSVRKKMIYAKVNGKPRYLIVERVRI